MAQKKDTTAVIAGLGILGIGAYYLLKKDEPTPAVESNFQVFSTLPEMTMHLVEVSQAGVGGTLASPHVFLGGMDGGFAKGLADANPSIQFIWTPDKTPPEGVADNLPWVTATGIPNKGTHAGQPDQYPGSTVGTGSAAQNHTMFQDAIVYAKTGELPG